MITPPTAQQATFVLDSATGDLQVLTPAGIHIASFGLLQQLELLHLITGAHLKLIAQLNAAALNGQAPAVLQLVDPIGNPVGK